MDPGYKKTITPVPEFGNRNLMVNVSLRILDILRIDEMKKTFTVKISLTREWMDRRLTYKNLKKESSNKNDLSKLEAESIWYPSLDINNIENNDKSEILEKNTKAEVATKSLTTNKHNDSRGIQTFELYFRFFL